MSQSNNLINRLEALSRAEHDDLSVAAEAAEEIKSLNAALGEMTRKVANLKDSLALLVF